LERRRVREIELERETGFSPPSAKHLVDFIYRFEARHWTGAAHTVRSADDGS